MYNRKEIKVRSTAKPKKDAFRNDMIYSKDGLFNPFVENKVRVPSNVITTHGMPGNVLAKVSDGRQVMMRPNQMYDFGPNVNYVDEEAQFSIGGGVQYMDVALNDDQIQEYKRGGYYIEDLPHAQDGIPQGTTIAADPTLTYAEYYAQMADAAKKAYDDYMIQIEKEKQRVSNVRGNVIPASKKLDAADNNMGSKASEADKKAWNDFTTASNPANLEKARKALPQYMKDLLPSQGKYNVARWDSQNNNWAQGADPNRELYCTPYGCFAYQKAGATDVPIIGGNMDFAQRAASGNFPFEKIPANQRQVGDMALWVETSPADYTDPSKGMTRRPHHTTIYASPDANEPNNPEAGNYYNADNGMRFNYGLTNYETDKEPGDRMDYYRYVGQTNKMEAELKKRLAAWEAAENKADRGPKPTLATLPVDASYFDTERPEQEIIKVDYHQQAVDKINNMDISARKKSKLLREANDNFSMAQKFQQLRYPNSQPAVGPLANSQNGQVLQLTEDQIQGFKDGGFYVEDLPEAQDGGYYTFSGRPGAKYTKDNSGKWMIESNGKYIPIKDPTGSRTKTLNAGAIYNAPQTKYAAPVTAPGGPANNIFADPKFMTSQQLQQKANNMAPTVEGTKWLEMSATQKQNEIAKKEYEQRQAQRFDQTKYDKVSGAGSSASTYVAPLSFKFEKQKEVAPVNKALPYVMSSTDDKGNVQLITQDQAQKIERDSQLKGAFDVLTGRDRDELEQVIGRKLTDAELYDEEGNYNLNGILGNYYNQGMLGKIENQKQKNFETANQKDWDNASWYDKARSTLSNLLADPVITLGNWSEFKGTPYRMSYGLRDEMNPEEQARFRTASNADDYWLNDWVNIINPGAIGADARVNYDQGQYANMAGNVASLIPLAKASKLLGAAGKLNTVKNIQKGIQTGLETPVLRTFLKHSTVGNPLLQTGENIFTKSLLNANVGNALTTYSRAALPGAAYNYAQDRTAANFSEMALLGLGTPEFYQGLNVGKTAVNQFGTAVNKWAPYGKLYPKTAANIIKGDAPFSFSSFGKGDLVNQATGAKLAKQEADYAAWLAGEGPALSATRGKFMTSAGNKDALAYAGDDLFTLRIPQTKGSAMSYNIQKQFANLESKIASGEPLTAGEQAIVQGADRSLLPSSQFDEALKAGAYSDLNLSDDMIKDLRTITENPNSYWELDIYKNNPKLQEILKDARFINKEEYLLDRLPSASEYKATTVPELEKELFSPINDFSESAAAIKVAAADKAAAERLLAANEQKVLSGKATQAQEDEEEVTRKKKKRKYNWNMGASYNFQDGGTSGVPMTYIDEPNVYGGGNERQFTPRSAQALKSFNNQIAYEGELSDAKIAELKRNGFVVEDINLRLPNNQQQHKPFQLNPYAFIAGNNDGRANNAIFGAGLHAQFDTPLKQLAAGITVGATDVLGFDDRKVLYNDFRVNNPMFNLNYTIPNKKR
jgi:hypothetical protein